MASVAFITVAAFSSSWQAAQANAISSALGVIHEAYTTNAVCGKKNCINPIFPGMEDLHLLQQAQWLTSSLRRTSKHMGFCRNAISYDPALPAPTGGIASVESLVRRQDNAASTMFYYHLSGLGLEAWDYQKPEFSGNDCIKSIWRMVCFTYFPRAEVGKPDGQPSKYLRPCQSSCMNYIRTCGVECCDESVQCVFTHSKEVEGKKLTSQGYVPHDGPSSLCTGAAHRGAKPMGALLWALVALKALFFTDFAPIASGFRSLLTNRKFVWFGALMIMALSLQGCDYDVPVHRVGNWRGQEDYLIRYEFIPPGQAAKNANLNSCSLSRLSQTLQCSGRGVCKMWDPGNLANTLTFCECDRDWADPECRTRRQSQLYAYLLSMFFGYTGADQFYLGHIGAGFMKLFSLGGFGIWWVYDIIRIGSAPVYASSFRVAHDLPHFAYVLTCTMFAVAIGFTMAYQITISYRSRKRKEAMLLQADEEARQQESLPRPFADSYGPGLDKPVMKSMYGSFGAGGPGRM